MKTLILTVTAGFGHHATAKALGDTLTAKGAEVKIVDVYEYLNRLVQETIAKGYLFSTKYTPEVYRFFYMLLENKDKDSLVIGKLNVIDIVNALGAFKFEKFVTDFAPDAIVCTHIFAAKLMNEMKKRNMVTAPSIGIVTDYTIHPYWEDCTELEYIETATHLVTHLAIKRGINENRVLPLGIPIHPKFNKRTDKATASAQLGLNPDKSTILIMGGSMGYNDNEEIVDQINSIGLDCQILAVCGNNKRQHRKLSALLPKTPNLHVYGFVDNVDIMMEAADCIITKPGGLTVTEALAKSLPMILINPIPGQEERNVEFLLNNGIALLVTKTFALSEALYHLFQNPIRLKSINENIEAISLPNATENLADFILNLKK